MIVNNENLLKKHFLKNYDKFNEIKKNVPYFYSYMEKLSDDLEISNSQLNNKLLSEKEEKFLLTELIFFKTSVFYSLILEEHIFDRFLKDIEIIKEINKTVSDLEETEAEEDNIEEDNKEIDEKYSFSFDEIEIKKLREKYKDLFLMTYSEEEKNKKRISYETKIRKLNNHIKHIVNKRKELIELIEKNELTEELYEKIIMKEARILIKLNPSLKYFKILLEELKKIEEKKPEFINDKWILSIEWGIKIIKEIIDILVMYNIRLVIKFVKSYQSMVPNNLSFNDIKHEGILGLIHAIYKFNPFKKWKLSTYATWWIKQHIISTINDNRNYIKVPLYYTKIISDYEKLKKEAENKGINLSDEEIAKKMGISVRKLKSAQNFVLKNSNISINDSGNNDDEEYSLEDILGAEINDERLKFDERLENEEILKFIKRIVEEENILNEKEKIIIKNRFELFTDKPESLQSIAYKMKLTKERIRQLENQAINKIINALKNYIQILDEYKELKEEDEQKN